MLLVVLALEVKSSEELHAVSSRIKARANRRLIKVECDQVAFMVYPKKVIISIVFVWDHLSRLTESQMQQIHTDYWFYCPGEINMTGVTNFGRILPELPVKKLLDVTTGIEKKFKKNSRNFKKLDINFCP